MGAQPTKQRQHTVVMVTCSVYYFWGVEKHRTEQAIKRFDALCLSGTQSELPIVKAKLITLSETLVVFTQ